MKVETKVFVVRCKPHGTDREAQFLEGIMSIGWFTQESLKHKNREELEKIYEKVDPSLTKMTITQIENFINIPVGSIILTPSYRNRDIHIFITEGEYDYKPEWAVDEIGNPHTIEVKHVKTVSRSHFSKIVNRALLAAKKTVTDFTKYSNEIQMVVEGHDIDTTTGSKSIIPTKKSESDAARETLKELLHSSNDEVRLKAALALLDKE